MATVRWRPPALMLLVLHLGACVTWTPARVSPREAIEGEPGRIRVYRSEGPRLELRRARIEGDALQGEMFRTPGRTVRVPLDDVTRIDVAHRSVGRTVLLVTTVAGVAVLVAAASAFSDWAEAY